ncbi:MAG: hypothetical protein Kow002_07750 [Anaerolineales bacterium]
MNSTRNKFSYLTLLTFLVFSLLLSSCGGRAAATGMPVLLSPTPETTPAPPWSGRPEYKPGELVDYTAQSGDTLPALAARFNTSVEEILAANPIIPRDATTMPPGMPMQIPIYYLPLWGEQFQSFPDSAFVYGPATRGFNSAAFLETQSGWFKDHTDWASGANRTGPELLEYVAVNFSINPRLLLAILEYQAGGLTKPEKPKRRYLLGYERLYYESVYLQLVGLANMLNNSYYGWRAGTLTEFELMDGSIYRPDPWQNAASVAVQYYFAQTLPVDEFRIAIGPNGLLRLYTNLFGDPWAASLDVIPGSLTQPDLRLPFPPGYTWSYTGGPHTGWGVGEPFAGIDFAPPSEHSGCFAVTPNDYTTAMADGVIARSEYGLIILDLDGDGDERTGWNILYLHVATKDRARTGQVVKAGEPVGYPSCEGGRTTGTHVHIARKYNGEWIMADGPIPFVMEGWVAHNGDRPYQGTLTKGSLVVIASESSDARSTLQAGQ